MTITDIIAAIKTGEETTLTIEATKLTTENIQKITKALSQTKREIESITFNNIHFEDMRKFECLLKAMKDCQTTTSVAFENCTLLEKYTEKEVTSRLFDPMRDFRPRPYRPAGTDEPWIQPAPRSKRQEEVDRAFFESRNMGLEEKLIVKERTIPIPSKESLDSYLIWLSELGKHTPMQKRIEQKEALEKKAEKIRAREQALNTIKVAIQNVSAQLVNTSCDAASILENVRNITCDHHDIAFVEISTQTEIGNSLETLACELCERAMPSCLDKNPSSSLWNAAVEIAMHCVKPLDSLDQYGCERKLRHIDDNIHAVLTLHLTEQLKRLPTDDIKYISTLRKLEQLTIPFNDNPKMSLKLCKAYVIASLRYQHGKTDTNGWLFFKSKEMGKINQLIHTAEQATSHTDLSRALETFIQTERPCLLSTATMDETVETCRKAYQRLQRMTTKNTTKITRRI